MADEQGQEAAIRSDYEAVCCKLNLDKESMDGAWDSYTTIKDFYTLEGPQLEWLACSLYVAGQSSCLETVEGRSVRGNNISLTQILRATKLNLIEFFKKIKKWLEMARSPQSLHTKVESLERKFEVASIIFEKYSRVFADLFRKPDENQAPTSRQRGRKAKQNRPCTPFEVFKFGWTLYIHVKSQYPQINDDLVNSHHLLLCCLDMLFMAAVLSKSRELLNPDCPFLPDPATEFDEPLCILPQLCAKYNAIEKECRVIREYYWRKEVKKLFDTDVLNGSTRMPHIPDAPFVHMLTPANFYNNDKHLNREYELNVLARGDFDERVFFHSSADVEIGTPPCSTPVYVPSYRLHGDHTPPNQYGTPLLHRERLPLVQHHMTPSSEATHSVTQLHMLLESHDPEPSAYLIKTCSACPTNPLPAILERLTTLRDKFLEESPAEGEEGPPAESFAKLRLHLSLSLYHKLLEAIVKDEERKRPDPAHLQTILDYELFHKSLFALCVEVVLFSYNSHSRVFPWVLEVFQVSAYHFYKLIEVVIKLERDFPRGIIKHLNRVEESVLSQLAWQSNSTLFSVLDDCSVPSYQEVQLPTAIAPRATPHSQPIHPRLLTLSGVKESPLSSLLGHDRFVSPGSTARRQLFSPGKSPRSPTKPIPIAPKPSQQGTVTVRPIPKQFLIQMRSSPSKQQQLDGAGISSPTNASMASTGTQTSPNRPAVTSVNPPSPHKGGLSIVSAAELVQASGLSPSRVVTVGATIPLSPPIPSVTITPSPGKLSTPGAVRPKRTGSLALFYRKMYQLAYIRIRDLCERLTLSGDFIQKVWTCFEHCMLKSPDLMRDRHLDQVIMCCIYVLSKVVRIEGVTFQEIMRQYRHQPQARSSVYRSVLLNSGPRDQRATSNSVGGASNEDHTPSDQLAKTTPVDQLLYPEDVAVGARGDIIKFYNKIFISFVKDYVLKFSPNETESHAPTLSPLPVILKTQPSPRKVRPNIFISPHKGCSPLSSQARQYITQKSPARVLDDINKSMREGEKLAGAKRVLDLTASPFNGSPAAKRVRVASSRSSQGSSMLEHLNSVASDRAKASSNSSSQ